MEEKDTSERPAEVEEEPAMVEEKPAVAEEEPAVRPAHDEGPALSPQANPEMATATDPGFVEAATPSFVYALGQIEFRFRSLGLERNSLRSSHEVETRG